MTTLKEMTYLNHARDMVTEHAVRITGEFADALDGEFTAFARELVAVRRRVTELEQQKPAVTTEEDRRQGLRDTMLKFMSGEFYKETAAAVRPTPTVEMTERDKALTYDCICKEYGVVEGNLGTFVSSTKRRADGMEKKQSGVDDKEMKVHTYDNLCAGYGVENGHLGPFIHKLKQKADRAEKLDEQITLLQASRTELSKHLDAARTAAKEARMGAKEGAEVCKEFMIVPGNLMQAFLNLKARVERLARDNGRLADKLADIRKVSGVQ